MYYTGIGSRRTPKEILVAFCYLGRELALRNYTLRSGGAEGADSCFEKGCDLVIGEKEIYLPWKGFNNNPSELFIYSNLKEAMQLAEKHHPYFNRLRPAARKLIARDGYQVLGKDLKTPSDFVICWTPGGSGEGGTGQAIRIARAYGIKVCDFGKYPIEQAMKIADGILTYVDKNQI